MIIIATVLISILIEKSSGSGGVPNSLDITFQSNSTHIKILSSYKLPYVNPTLWERNPVNRATWRCVWMQYNSTSGTELLDVNPDDIRPNAIIEIPKQDGELQLQCKLIIPPGLVNTLQREYIEAKMPSRIRYSPFTLPSFNSSHPQTANQTTSTRNQSNDRKRQKFCYVSYLIILFLSVRLCGFGIIVPCHIIYHN